jgi:TRAP-type C4-dicarboxylate transport system permease small subunit
VFTVFACLLGALVSIAFAWFGLMKALENTAIGSTADVSAVITWPVYYLVPIVFVLLAVLYVLDAIATFAAAARWGSSSEREHRLHRRTPAA